MEINGFGTHYIRTKTSAARKADKTVATSVGGAPNWSYIPSKGMSNKTQAQFETEITELAKRAAGTSNKGELASIRDQVTKLQAEYLSDVAPDRKQMYEEAQKAAKSNADVKGNKPLGEMSLFNFLISLSDGNNLSNKSYSLSSGTLSFAYNGSGYDTIIQNGGVNALMYSKAGWSYEMTPAEIAKKDEFYAIYQRAYKAEKALQQGNSEMSFSIKA